MSPDTFRKLAAAGLTNDQMVVVLEIMDERERAVAEAEETRKAVVRARVQRWRDKQKDGSVTLPKRDSNATKRLTRGIDNPSNSEIKEGKKEEDSAPAAPSPQDELETVLDAKRAAAVVAHRKGLRKPLTAHAAGLLAKQLARWPDPNEAADEMIERGWAGFKPAWMPQQGQGPPGKQQTSWERTFQALKDEADEQQGYDDTGTDGVVLSLPGARAQRQ